MKPLLLSLGITIAIIAFFIVIGRDAKTQCAGYAVEKRRMYDFRTQKYIDVDVKVCK